MVVRPVQQSGWWGPPRDDPVIRFFREFEKLLRFGYRELEGCSFPHTDSARKIPPGFSTRSLQSNNPNLVFFLPVILSVARWAINWIRRKRLSAWISTPVCIRDRVYSNVRFSIGVSNMSIWRLVSGLWVVEVHDRLERKIGWGELARMIPNVSLATKIVISTKITRFFDKNDRSNGWIVIGLFFTSTFLVLRLQGFHLSSLERDTILSVKDN